MPRHRLHVRPVRKIEYTQRELQDPERHSESSHREPDGIRQLELSPGGGREFSASTKNPPVEGTAVHAYQSGSARFAEQWLVGLLDETRQASLLIGGNQREPIQPV